MRHVNRYLVLLFAFSILNLAACSGTPVQLSQGNQYIDITDVDFSKGRRVTGAASGFQLLLFFPISINSRHARAYEQLLSQARGDYVTNVQVEESWTYAFVGTVHTTSMEAMAYPRKSAE